MSFFGIPALAVQASLLHTRPQGKWDSTTQTLSFQEPFGLSDTEECPVHMLLHGSWEFPFGSFGAQAL